MYLAVDIGGTKTLIALFSARGRKLKAVKFPTPLGRADFLTALVAHLRDFSSRHIRQIVVAIPGVVQKDYSFQFGNRPWHNFDLITPIKNLFNCPVHLQNDANLATIFETRNLRGRSIYLTLSTGIGGGIAENRKLLERASNHFEPGHAHYIYNGLKLEWEDIASAEAIGTAYQTIATSVRGRKAYADIAARLTPGLTDIILHYHPDNIVLGGPLSQLFPHFHRPLRKQLRQALDNSATATATRLPKLYQAEKPQESVIYGCFLVAQERDGRA